MSRTAVVTGAYGYLGSIIRSRLNEAGWSTIALVREPRAGDQAATWALGRPAPEDVLQGVDALIHCAYDFAPRSRSEVWRINVEGSRQLLHTAKRLDVQRILVLSSLSAYSGTHQIYGRAKLAIEAVTLHLGGIAVRPGLVYGDQPAGMAGALVKLARLSVVPVFGNHARQFPVHQDDFAMAIVRILDTPDWTPEVFGIAQPDALSLRELLTALAGREGTRPRFIWVPWRAVYGALRFAEVVGLPFPLRADSVLGLVRPAPLVPPSSAFPDMLDELRTLSSIDWR